jgi:hypothetical protein
MGVGAAALLYAGITAVLFRALLPNLGTHVFPDPGDPLLLAAILGWNASQVPLTDAWWNFPAFAPAEGVTAFTEHMLLTYPVASPIVWATGNPLLAYNVVLLLAKPLSGAAAFVLGRELTGSWAAGWIAGLAFIFAPYQGMHASHLQLLLSFGMPLTLLGLHRFLRGGGARALALFAVGWLTTALANAYLLVFFPLVVVMYCAWFVRPAEWRRLIPLLAAAGLVTLALAPLLWGYHVRLAAYGLARELGEIRAFSADVVGLAGMFYTNTAWRGLLPHDFEERALFSGFTIVALAVLALWSRNPDSSHSDRRREPGPPGVWSRRLLAASAVVTAVVLARIQAGPFGRRFGPVPLPQFDPHRVFSLAAVLFVAAVLTSRWFRRAWSRRDPVVFFGVAVVVLWLLALGPLPEWSTPRRFVTYGPYWLLMQVPGVDAVRVPARIWLIAVLCLAVLAAYGTAVLLGRYTRRPRLAVAALTLLIVVEGWFTGPIFEAPVPIAAGVIPEGAVVLELPITGDYRDAVPQYRGIVGRYRTINGYSGHYPPFFESFINGIDKRSDEALRSYLRAADLYVIIKPDVDPAVIEWIASLPGATMLSAAGDAHVYRLPHRLAAGNR